MSKINILNLVLFIIVISLAIVIYFSESENNQLALLNDTDTSTIKSISIRHNNSRTTLARTDTQQWEITQPIAIAANNFRVNSLLKLLNAPVHKQYDVSKIDLASIGLLDSATMISFDDKIITFGISNSATSLRYIMLDGFVYT